MIELLVEVNTGIFRKKDNSFRKMRFVKLKDLPAEFVNAKLTGKKSHILQEGLELVWDLESNEFRTFNWNTLIMIEKQSEKIVL